MIESIITFFQCLSLETVHRFYHDCLGLELLKDQGVCRIYKTLSGAVGFCTHLERTSSSNIICFVLKDRQTVDEYYEKVRDFGIEILTKPTEKEEFAIYQFFANDMEGNKVEFQCFL
ncbi:MAG TPA: glyoxalase [Clostridiales bacterium]|jgi:predicted enzyme related to lactoylglutathione lyase|nr:glyoxalase [Clostridiales bacterium]